ncbi:MAG TPA: hypothetical protein VH478_24880 [Trebonia sp.]|jgi:hypothetical protein|nr:hypothetical protein [Trebonia sp.]
MAEWWSVEVFSGDARPASAWRVAWEDQLTEAAATHGALYWEWHDTQYGVVFEACFPADEQWLAFRALPVVAAGLDAVPDPVNGLLVYRGRGGTAGARKPRGPRPAPSAAAVELDEPRVARPLLRYRAGAGLDQRREELSRADPPVGPGEPGEPAEPGPLPARPGGASWPRAASGGPAA